MPCVGYDAPKFYLRCSTLPLELLRKEDMFKRMNGRYSKAKVRPKQAKKAQSENRGIPVRYK